VTALCIIIRGNIYNPPDLLNYLSKTILWQILDLQSGAGARHAVPLIWVPCDFALSNLWIPAFAGMGEREAGVSWNGCERPLDSGWLWNGLERL